MSRSEAFIEKYMPYAQQMEQSHGVPALVALAQSALETGWGRHAPGNMMFDKTGKSWRGKKQLLTTTEYHSTDQVKYPEILSITKVSRSRFKYRVKDWFRKYDSPYESFVDYARLLKGSTRYAKAFQFTQDPYRFAQEIARAGYATAPDYFYRIRVIMDMIKKKAPSA